VSDGKKSAAVKVDAQEREEVSTPLGKFKTIRHEVHMFNNVLINKKARLSSGSRTTSAVSQCRSV
jgi:hypothetical protein